MPYHPSKEIKGTRAHRKAVAIHRRAIEKKKKDKKKKKD